MLNFSIQYDMASWELGMSLSLLMNLARMNIHSLIAMAVLQQEQMLSTWLHLFGDSTTSSNVKKRLPRSAYHPWVP